MPPTLALVKEIATGSDNRNILDDESVLAQAILELHKRLDKQALRQDLLVKRIEKLESLRQ